MSPAYEQNMSPDGGNHLEMFPRYKSLKILLSVARKKFRYRKQVDFPCSISWVCAYVQGNNGLVFECKNDAFHIALQRK